jgi:hypothetical protein
MKWDTDYDEQWRRCVQGSGWRIRIGSDCDGGNNLGVCRTVWIFKTNTKSGGQVFETVKKKIVLLSEGAFPPPFLPMAPTTHLKNYCSYQKREI